MLEVWKDIDGYEGSYQISNLSRIKSLKRNITTKNNIVLPIKERILKQAMSSTGYYIVAIQKEDKQQMFKVHRLIAIAFIPNPFNKRTVNHINGIKTDNRLENIEWATDLENTQHARINGYCSDEKEVNQIKDGIVVNTFKSLSHANRQTGIQISNISYCCSGARKNAGGFQWEYNKLEVTK